MEYVLLEFSYGYEGGQSRSPAVQFTEWQSKEELDYEVVSMSSSISSVGDQVVESLFIMIKYL